MCLCCCAVFSCLFVKMVHLEGLRTNSLFSLSAAAFVLVLSSDDAFRLSRLTAFLKYVFIRLNLGNEH